MNTDPGLVRDLFAGHYFLFAFLASLGTLQIAVSNAGTKGLWLTPHAGMTRVLGILLILTGIAVFFLQPLWVEGPWAAGSVEADSLTREWGKAGWSEIAGARNVNDIHGGLDGTKQAMWFSLAVLAAFAVSAVAGSLSVRIIRLSEEAAGKQSDDVSSDGLEGLSSRSFFANLPISWKNFRAEIRQVWDNSIRNADSWSLFKKFFRGGTD